MTSVSKKIMIESLKFRGQVNNLLKDKMETEMGRGIIYVQRRRFSQNRQTGKQQ